MYIFFMMLAEDPSVELYYPLIALLVLLPAALGYFFSLRVSAAYYIALLVGLLFGDAVMLVPLALGGGASSGEAAIAFLLIGMCAIPLAFLFAFIVALVYLPAGPLKSVAKKYRACAFAAGVLLMLVPLIFGKGRIDSPEAFNELVRTDPAALGGKRVGDFFLKGENLVFENITFDGTDFIKSKIHNMTFRNVTFKNCLFKESTFEDLSLENVTFENCTFARFASDYYDRGADFVTDVCDNVVFSGGRLEFLRFNAPSGSDVTVKNVTFRAPKKGYIRLFGGGAVNLRIDNCTFDGEMTLAWMEGHDQATLHVTDSRFTVPESMLFRCSDMKVVWLENCHFATPSVPSGETTVIKNYHLATSVRQSYRDVTQQKRPESEWRKQTIYVENCEFPVQLSDWGWEYGMTFYNRHPGNDIYVFGKQPRQEKVNLSLSGGGRISVFDAELRLFDTGGGDDAPTAEVNFKNVILDGGPWREKFPPIDFSRTVLAGGRWEEVSIFPQVDMKDADIRALTVHKIRFPKGEPWIHADANTFSTMKVSESPLDIPRPRIPTLTELGVVDRLGGGQ